MDKKIKVSIIIVNYHSEGWILQCIESIRRSKNKTPYEIIIVDNNERENLFLLNRANRYKVSYIVSHKNKGFAAACNLGAAYAKGEYILFLNPDTRIMPGCIDALYLYLKSHIKVGVVSPIILDQNEEVYKKQGVQILTPFSAFFALSIIEKLFPNNEIAKNYWNYSLDKNNPSEVGVVPGTAFMVKKSIYQKVGGMDEKFFLYFEENDFCKRVHEAGYKVIMNPHARVVHYWGKSTQKRKDIQKIFNISRRHYLTKHFGWKGFLTHVLIDISYMHVFILLTLAIGSFLYFYRIGELMMFIGDQGWFYLSARDMLLTGNIPLVGITSSHTWLHQGPLWTYLLGIIFMLSSYNPVAPAIFTGILGLITTILFFYTATLLFGRQAGIISTILYVTSPLVVIHTRMPYHTSPIPFLVVLFILSYFFWLEGKNKFLYALLFLVSLLYNFQLSTIPFLFLIIATFLYGFIKKRVYVQPFLNVKSMMLSILLFFIPMIPILIYDTKNGFMQTIVYMGWIPYKIISFFFNTQTVTNENTFITFLGDQIQKLIYLPSMGLAIIVLIITYIMFILLFLRFFQTREYKVLFLTLIFPLAGLFANMSPSEAYVPMLIPQTIMLIGVVGRYLHKVGFVYITIFTLISLSVGNVVFLVRNDFLMKKINGYGYFFSERVGAAKNVISLAKDRPYNLYVTGAGAQFNSFRMNYEYLLWYYGHPPSNKKENLSYVIAEQPYAIKVSTLTDQK